MPARISHWNLSLPPVLAALLAVPAAQAGFEPGAPSVLGSASLPAPAGVVALADDTVFVLHPGKEGRAVLRSYRFDQAWKPGRQWVLEGATRIAAGRNFINVLRSDDTFVRHTLARNGQDWDLGPARTVVDAALLKAAGVGTAQLTRWGMAPDGSLLFSYGRALLRVEPAQGPDGKASFQWLLDQAPGERGNSDSAAPSTPPGAGLIVAADARSRALAIDPRNRMVYRIDPQTKAKDLIKVQGEVWADFEPDDALAWEDTLFVTGKRVRDKRHTLVLLEPLPETAPGKPGPFQARDLDLDLELSPDTTYALAPAGHLFLSHAKTGLVTCVRNAQAPAQPGLETKVAARGPANANPGTRPARDPRDPRPHPFFEPDRKGRPDYRVLRLPGDDSGAAPAEDLLTGPGGELVWRTGSAVHTLSPLGHPSETPLPDDEHLWAQVLDAQGRLWCFGRKRITLFDLASQARQPVARLSPCHHQPTFVVGPRVGNSIQAGRPNSVAAGPDGEIWVSHHEGVERLRFDSATATLTREDVLRNPDLRTPFTARVHPSRDGSRVLLLDDEAGSVTLLRRGSEQGETLSAPGALLRAVGMGPGDRLCVGLPGRIRGFAPKREGDLEWILPKDRNRFPTELYRLAPGPDGALWGTEPERFRVWRIGPEPDQTAHWELPDFSMPHELAFAGGRAQFAVTGGIGSLPVTALAAESKDGKESKVPLTAAAPVRVNLSGEALQAILKHRGDAKHGSGLAPVLQDATKLKAAIAEGLERAGGVEGEGTRTVDLQGRFYTFCRFDRTVGCVADNGQAKPVQTLAVVSVRVERDGVLEHHLVDAIPVSHAADQTLAVRGLESASSQDAPARTGSAQASVSSSGRRAVLRGLRPPRPRQDAAVFIPKVYPGGGEMARPLNRAGQEYALPEDLKQKRNLAGMDLSLLDLRRVDLRGRDLRGWRLAGLDLTGAQLEGANLTGVSLEGTMMSGAGLMGTIGFNPDGVQWLPFFEAAAAEGSVCYLETPCPADARPQPPRALVPGHGGSIHLISGVDDRCLEITPTGKIHRREELEGRKVLGIAHEPGEWPRLWHLAKDRLLAKADWFGNPPGRQRRPVEWKASSGLDLPEGQPVGFAVSANFVFACYPKRCFYWLQDSKGMTGGDFGFGEHTASHLAVSQDGRYVAIGCEGESLLVTFDRQEEMVTLTGLPEGTSCTGLAAAADKTFWYTYAGPGGRGLGHLDPLKEGTANCFPFDGPGPAEPRGLAIGHNGLIWFADGKGALCQVQPLPTGEPGFFRIRSHFLPKGDRPLTVAPAGGGKVYFTLEGTGRIGVAQVPPLDDPPAQAKRSASAGTQADATGDASRPRLQFQSSRLVPKPTRRQRWARALERELQAAHRAPDPAPLERQSPALETKADPATLADGKASSSRPAAPAPRPLTPLTPQEQLRAEGVLLSEAILHKIQRDHGGPQSRGPSTFDQRYGQLQALEELIARGMVESGAIGKVRSETVEGRYLTHCIMDEDVGVHRTHAEAAADGKGRRTNQFVVVTEPDDSGWDQVVSAYPWWPAN